MNKVVYKDDSKNIPGFSEALTDEPNNFMWDILNLMDDLYKVSHEYAYLIFKNPCVLFIRIFSYQCSFIGCEPFYKI